MKHKSKTTKLVKTCKENQIITTKDIKSLGIFSLFHKQAPQTSLKPPTFVNVQHPENIQNWTLVFAPNTEHTKIEEINALDHLKFETTASGSKFKIWPPLQDFSRIALDARSKNAKQKQHHQTAETKIVDLDHLKINKDVAIATGYPENGIQLATKQPSKSPNAYALDCEMCLAGEKQVLTRIAILNFETSECVFESFIKPKEHITEYLTKFSGVTKELLQNVETTLDDVHKWMLENISPNDFLIGHSLESDLKVLNITHMNCVDTAYCYPHPAGFPLKLGLKYLSKKYLGEEIQNSEGGHSPIEDALTCIKLVKLKQEQGEDFGVEIYESAVPLTKFLNNHHISSLVLDTEIPHWDHYGTGDHMLAFNDRNVVDLYLRNLKSEKRDEKSKFYFLGLRSENPQELITEVLEESSPNTLITVWTGTESMNSVKELLAKRRQFQREYATKNWNDIENPWTDKDNNELASEVEKAKHGYLYCYVTPEHHHNQDQDQDQDVKTTKKRRADDEDNAVGEFRDELETQSKRQKKENHT